MTGRWWSWPSPLALRPAPADLPAVGESGATEDGLRRLGRRYAVLVRTAVLLCASGAALVQAAPDRRTLVAVVVVALAAWSVVYTRFGSGGWLLLVDTAVIMLLGLTQRWTVPPDALGDSTNWVLAVVTITVVAHQWLTSAALGALLTTAIVAAHLTGNVLAAADPPAGSVPLGLWTFAEAGLSRVLYLLVRTGARQADLAVAVNEQARREAAVAAARRAEEREHLAVLHDTAASTLLAVGSGLVDGTEPWLVEQAARDLEILAARPDPDGGDTDLVRLLQQVVRQAPIAVEVCAPPAVPMPAFRATAVSAAVREALTNVVRHAGTNAADLTVRRTGGWTVVEVADRGRGFTPERVPVQRRGLSHSIAQRMTRVGGRAVVTSRPGHGTRVSLEVPDG
ncbi:sensor histidine kinase [Plantactinospora sonchi]|uniref:ATP-binding protein n=1 Tax=Plantactinospora sonchi TaxID=1544735 RepID=A0ABU7RYD5_9ACTN